MQHNARWKGQTYGVLKGQNGTAVCCSDPGIPLAVSSHGARTDDYFPNFLFRWQLLQIWTTGMP